MFPPDVMPSIESTSHSAVTATNCETVVGALSINLGMPSYHSYSNQENDGHPYTHLRPLFLLLFFYRLALKVCRTRCVFRCPTVSSIRSRGVRHVAVGCIVVMVLERILPLWPRRIFNWLDDIIPRIVIKLCVRVELEVQVGPVNCRDVVHCRIVTRDLCLLNRRITATWRFGIHQLLDLHLQR